MLSDRLNRFMDPADVQALQGWNYRAIEGGGNRLESALCRALILESLEDLELPAMTEPVAIPNRIMQFWDQKAVPPDVEACMSTWMRMDGFDYVRFDSESASEFIGEHFGPDHLAAYAYCHHPAMRCDYFRLCYLLVEGGIYIDADDVCLGPVMQGDLTDHGLRLTFMCTSDDQTMVPRERILAELAHETEWRCYFNNDPLLSVAQHPVLKIALHRSMSLILKARGSGEKCSIHWVTGPENLTFSLVEYACRCLRDNRKLDFSSLLSWSRIGAQRWDLGYRSTDRDWRSNATIV